MAVHHNIYTQEVVMESIEEIVLPVPSLMEQQQALSQRVSLLKMFKDEVEKAYDEARVALEETMTPGSRVAAMSPLDRRVKLGSCTLTEPKNETSIVDQEAFLEWVSRHYPDKVKPDFEYAGTREQIVVALYDAGHRDLLKLVSVVDTEFVRKLRIDSSEMGYAVGPEREMDIPGVKVKAADPVLRCLPGKRAKAEFAEIVRSGAVSIDDLLGGA